MTFVVLVLAGFGVLLVVSSVENVPVAQTFQEIISGQTPNLASATATGANATTGGTGGTSTAKSKSVKNTPQNVQQPGGATAVA